MRPTDSRSPQFNNSKKSRSRPRIFKNKPTSVQKVDRVNNNPAPPVINSLINNYNNNPQSNGQQFQNLFDARTANSESFRRSYVSNGVSHLSYI